MEETKIMSPEEFDQEYLPSLRCKTNERIKRQRARVNEYMLATKKDWIKNPIWFKGKEFECNVPLDEQMEVELCKELEDIGWQVIPDGYSNGRYYYCITRSQNGAYGENITRS